MVRIDKAVFRCIINSMKKQNSVNWKYSLKLSAGVIAGLVVMSQLFNMGLDGMELLAEKNAKKRELKVLYNTVNVDDGYKFGLIACFNPTVFEIVVNRFEPAANLSDPEIAKKAKDYNISSILSEAHEKHHARDAQYSSATFMLSQQDKSMVYMGKEFTARAEEYFKIRNLVMDALRSSSIEQVRQMPRECFGVSGAQETHIKYYNDLMRDFYNDTILSESEIIKICDYALDQLSNVANGYYQRNKIDNFRFPRIVPIFYGPDRTGKSVIEQSFVFGDNRELYPWSMLPIEYKNYLFDQLSKTY